MRRRYAKEIELFTGSAGISASLFVPASRELALLMEVGRLFAPPSALLVVDVVPVMVQVRRIEGIMKTWKT